ncbi:ubiquitin-like FUBI-ribosomal protein eS30 fusion protein [Tubulanus polymorphus]|uniref:ubiquitin-like FUBI-ribosomal protein eS30 fusion protein n=1 Tax=Tubulanus polymorphus TaxID=672921 RepID=UPI003DA584D6
MQLFVTSQQVHALQVTGQETVLELKRLVEAREGTPATDLIFFNGGRPLNDEDVLDQCVEDLTSIDAEVRLLGGKVHGSLARAGKVKGQTPKVEKQEKKKKKTGRAKRRMQYNRRFVNVVQTFGRRRGPNSNS